MIDALNLLDRMIERKQEAFERYTGRTRLAIRTEIETLRHCRQEILRLDEEVRGLYLLLQVKRMCDRLIEEAESLSSGKPHRTTRFKRKNYGINDGNLNQTKL